jgi:shikimate dehydrogenase
MLASPVGGIPTQYMFEKAFNHHDLDWRYLTFEVASENLGDAIRGFRALGFCGGHCAFPHKKDVLPLLDRITQTAAMVGCVNLIFREENALVGDNIEGRSVVQTIRGVIEPAGKKVVLLGAGQMARAIAVELAAANVLDITVLNRTETHAAELVTMLNGKFETPVVAMPWSGDYSVPLEADILIQATSLGEETLPLLVSGLRPEILVADVTPSPRTWLLDEATQRGCKTVDGLSMCIEQAAMGFQLWTNVIPDRQVLREAIEEFWEL